MPLTAEQEQDIEDNMPVDCNHYETALPFHQRFTKVVNGVWEWRDLEAGVWLPLDRGANSAPPVEDAPTLSEEKTVVLPDILHYTKEMEEAKIPPDVGMQGILLVDKYIGTGVLKYISEEVVVWRDNIAEEEGPYPRGQVTFLAIEVLSKEEKTIQQMEYAYNKGSNMEDVLSEVKKGYIKGLSYSEGGDER